MTVPNSFSSLVANCRTVSITAGSKVASTTLVVPGKSNSIEQHNGGTIWNTSLETHAIWKHTLVHIPCPYRILKDVSMGNIHPKKLFPCVISKLCLNSTVIVNTLRPRQDGRHFPDDILKWIFLNENLWISLKILLKFVPRVLINNISTLVQMMIWRRLDNTPLSEPMMVCLLTHIYASLGLNELRVASVLLGALVTEICKIRSQ